MSEPNYTIELMPMDALIRHTKALQDERNEYLSVINMLILCGEEPCRNVDSYAGKLRALIDAYILQKRTIAQLKEEISALRSVNMDHDARVIEDVAEQLLVTDPGKRWSMSAKFELRRIAAKLRASARNIPSSTSEWTARFVAEWVRENWPVKAWIDDSHDGREICISASELNSSRQSDYVREQWKRADKLFAIPDKENL